jgi:hypothetical protein
MAFDCGETGSLAVIAVPSPTACVLLSRRQSLDRGSL